LQRERDLSSGHARFSELGCSGDAELAQEVCRSLSGLPPPGKDCSCSVAANSLIGSWAERWNTVLNKASLVLPGLGVVDREDTFWGMEHL